VDSVALNNEAQSRAHKSDLRHLLVLLPIAGLLFAIGIRQYDLWPADEPRFAQVAREMMLSGDYLSPTINGDSYLEKPPLLFWSIAAVSQPGGDVSEFSARLPSVLAAIATVVFTYLLGTGMFGARAGLWSAIVLMTCLRFWWQARTVQTDMLLTAFLASALYWLWRWDNDRKRWQLVALYASLSLAMLTKGPPALVFPLLFIFAFYWRDRAARKRLHWIMGFAVVLLITALWYVPARLMAEISEGGAVEAGIGGNLFRNIIGRVFLGVSKAQPPWYYITNLPADLFPWTLFAPWVLLHAWRERRANRPMFFLMAWLVPAFIFFTLTLGKRATYILPLYPVFAILIARGVLEFMDANPDAWRRRITYLWGAGLLILGVLMLATPHLAISGYTLSEQFDGQVSFFGAILVLCAAYALIRERYSHRSPLHRVIAAQTAIVFACVGIFIFPVVDSFKSAKDFCAPLRHLTEQGKFYRLYSAGFSREEYVFYSKHTHEALLTNLIGAEGLSGDALIDLAKLQRRARGLIADAVEPLVLKDLGAPTPEELATLRQAIEEATLAAGDDADRMLHFEEQLQEVLDAFQATFDANDPAFLFVQDSDWKWMLPLYSTPPQYALIQQENVGRRRVLLLANPAGASLLQRALGPAALS